MWGMVGNYDGLMKAAALELVVWPFHTRQVALDCRFGVQKRHLEEFPLVVFPYSAIMLDLAIVGHTLASLRTAVWRRDAPLSMKSVQRVQPRKRIPPISVASFSRK